MTQPGVTVHPFAHPVHAILLAFPVALYPSALLADIAYLNTAEIQWSNFASWMIVGADIVTGIVLGWAILSIFIGRARQSRARGLLYVAAIGAMLVSGAINALQHARDGWHSVGSLGLTLSILCSVLALFSAFIAYSSTHAPAERAT